MQVKKLVVFGLGQRGNIFAAYAKKYPQQFLLTAIIENNPIKIEQAKKEYVGVPIYTDYKAFLETKTPADLVAVATQDEQHKEHAVAMMQAGYDLLLEKPIANHIEDCYRILTCVWARLQTNWQRSILTALTFTTNNTKKSLPPFYTAVSI